MGGPGVVCCPRSSTLLFASFVTALSSKIDEAGVIGEQREPEVVDDGVEFEDAIERCSFVFDAALEKGKGNTCEIRSPRLEVVLVLH